MEYIPPGCMNTLVNTYITGMQIKNDLVIHLNMWYTPNPFNKQDFSFAYDLILNIIFFLFYFRKILFL